MKKLLATVAFASLFSLAGVIAADSPKEVLNFKIGDDWKAVSHSESGKGGSITYIREGDDLSHWKEIFTYLHGVRRRGLRSPEKELGDVEANEKKKSPGLMEWNIVSQDENSILFESHTKWSTLTHEQRAIMRIIHGKYNWYTLSYAAKVHDLDPDTRAQWIKTFSDAAITTDSSASPGR